MLVNNTPYDWSITYAKSYQMNNWVGPPSAAIKAGEYAQYYVEYKTGPGVTEKNDAGEANFSFNAGGKTHTFQVQARWDLVLQVVPIDFNTCQNLAGKPIKIPIKHNGVGTFFLSGTAEHGFFSTGTPPATWMSLTLPVIGDTPLIDLCITGSHDSGMSTVNGKTFGITNGDNVKTQKKNVKNQLLEGARYFDIRPAIHSGQFYTGHYSNAGEQLGFMGANGESLKAIIDGVNEYTATHPELVILHLTHDLNTDHGKKYARFTSEEWDRLMMEMSQIKMLYKREKFSEPLTSLPLKDFIGGGRAAVIVIIDGPTKPALGDFDGKGFYLRNQFAERFFDSYSNAIDFQKMQCDQIRKLQLSSSPRSALGNKVQFCVLSWTITMDALNSIFNGSIIKAASNANWKLASTFWPSFCKTLTHPYPAVLYVDDFQAKYGLSDLAVAINIFNHEHKKTIKSKSLIKLDLEVSVANEKPDRRSKLGCSAGELTGAYGRDNHRLEGFNIQPHLLADIEYQAHIEGLGDTAWEPAGTFIGTKGENRRMEGFAVRIVGPGARTHTVRYYAHVEGSGLSPIISDGTYAGSRGEGKPIAAMAVWLEPL